MQKNTNSGPPRLPEVEPYTVETPKGLRAMEATGFSIDDHGNLAVVRQEVVANLAVDRAPGEEYGVKTTIVRVFESGFWLSVGKRESFASVEHEVIRVTETGGLATLQDALGSFGEIVHEANGVYVIRHRRASEVVE